jgi:hypothetical protein
LEPPPLAQLREIAERAELGNDGLSRRAYDADPCVQPSRSSRGTDDTHMTPSPTSGGFPIGAIHVSQAAMDVCLVPTGALRHQRHALRHQRQHLPQQHLHQQLVAHRAVASVPTALTALARCLTPPDSSLSRNHHARRTSPGRPGGPHYFHGRRCQTTPSTSRRRTSLVAICPRTAADKTPRCSRSMVRLRPYEVWVAPDNISNNQHNGFNDNTYSGPWSLLGFNHGDNGTWNAMDGGVRPSEWVERPIHRTGCRQHLQKLAICDLSRRQLLPANCEPSKRGATYEGVASQLELADGALRPAGLARANS